MNMYLAFLYFLLHGITVDAEHLPTKAQIFIMMHPNIYWCSQSRSNSWLTNEFSKNNGTFQMWGSSVRFVFRKRNEYSTALNLPTAGVLKHCMRRTPMGADTKMQLWWSNSFPSLRHTVHTITVACAKTKPLLGESETKWKTVPHFNGIKF